MHSQLNKAIHITTPHTWAAYNDRHMGNNGRHIGNIWVTNGEHMGDKCATYNDGIAQQTLFVSGLCNT